MDLCMVCVYRATGRAAGSLHLDRCQAGGGLMGWLAGAWKVYVQPKRHIKTQFFKSLHFNVSCLSVCSSCLFCVLSS